MQRTPVVGRFASGSYCRVFWLFKKHANGVGRISCRSECSYILRPGEPVGQALMIGFSILYGILSFRCAYYGEMITYLGMSRPMAALSMVSWLRHPFEKGKSQVQIERLSLNKIVCLFFFSLLVTGIFYVVLKELNTVHLKWSTISVFTSFAAVLLTFWRSPYYALGYAANDLVLIVLWTLQHDIVMILCFAVFLINDLYGFCNWRKMEKIQQER